MKPKSERDRELHAKRSRVLNLLIAQLNTACDSHKSRNIKSMQSALERMLASILSLIDPDVNDEKRTKLLHVLEEAIASGQEADIVQEKEKKTVYVRGDFDIDKLVSSVVWVKPKLTIDMREIGQEKMEA